MNEYIVEELMLDGAYNSNRFIFNSIKSNINSNGIIIFPIDIKNIDSNKYNNKNYIIGNFLNGNATIRGINYTANSLSIALPLEINLIPITKLICDKFNQDNCLLKDNINNKLFVIRRERYKYVN